MGLLHTIRHAAYRYKYVNAPKLDLKVPVDLCLELSSTCQNRCGYCYWSKPESLPFTKGFMSFELAKSCLEQGAELGVHSLKYNYRGESLLNPRFEDITALAKSLATKSTYIDRITNSNFNFKDTREDLFRGLANQTKVKVSFDSFDHQVMETQRAKSNPAQVEKNIDIFYNHPARIKSDTILVIQAVRTKLNKDEDIAGTVKKKWPSALVSVRNCVEGRVDSDVSAYVNYERDFSERQSCIQFHARMIVNHDGRVTGCCPDIKSELVIGDAKTDSLYTIFNSEAAQKIRKSLLDKSAFENSPCKSCSSFESFKGYVAPMES